MPLPTTITIPKFTRIAPGSYEAHVADVTTVDYAHGVYVRVFTNCDCGRCFPWVVTISDETYETERIEQIKTLKRAKEVAAILVHNIRNGR